MTVRRCTASVFLAMTCTSAASAAFDATMYQLGGLSSFTNLVQTLDITSTSYNFPSTSGFAGAFLPNGTIDQTQLVTNVYEVTQQTSLGPGGLTLNAGDMIFAYTIRLVAQSTVTVSTMDEFQVQGFFGGPGDIMDGTLVMSRGVLAAGAGISSPLGGTAADFSTFGAFGSILDYQWSGDPTMQLNNSESITLLMFTGRASIGNGQANLISNLATSGGGSFDPFVNGVPVLIPTTFVPPVPAPGAASVLVLGVAAFSSRRRRNNG